MVNANTPAPVLATPPPRTAVPNFVPRPDWTIYSNDTNCFNQMVFDNLVGNLWAVGCNGDIQFDLRDIANSIRYRRESSPFTQRLQSIAVGSNAAFWYGTTDGIAIRFDGKTWASYKLIDDAIPAIAVANDGSAWFAVREKYHYVSSQQRVIDDPGGVIQFDGKNWTRYFATGRFMFGGVALITQAPDSTL